MIYVDQLIDYGREHVKRGRYSGKWCHMATDGDIEELHQFAKSIGLKRSWFQDHPRVPHYDLTPSKRRLAIQNGAINSGPAEFFLMCCKKEEQ